MQETHVIYPVRSESILPGLVVYNWNCPHCDYHGQVRIGRSGFGIYHILNEGDLLIRHVCKKYTDVDVVLEQCNSLAEEVLK